MDQLAKDPSIGPIVSNNRGAKLYQALQARLKAENNPTNRRLIEDVLRDRRWFLEPLTSAPTMSTINGIGTMLYGESERDPDGTYVSTLFFTFVFVPIYPIAQYLVRPLGGRKWSFFGKVPPSAVIRTWRSVVRLAAAAAALAIVWGIVESRGHSDVYFVNALDIPVQIHAGKEDVKVPAGDRVMKRLAEGELEVRVQGEGGRVLDQGRVKIPGGYDVVAYNVLGAAPLYKENVTYYANTPPKDDNGEEPILRVGETLVTEKDIDFVFREQPKTIEMPKGSLTTVKTHFDVAPGGWKLSVAYLLTKEHPKEALALVEKVVTARPDSMEALGMALALVQRIEGPDALLPFSQKLAAAAPDAVEIQRLYQNEMMLNGRRDELRKQYQERAQKQPGSATAAYLAARIEMTDEAIKQFRALLQKFPKDVLITRGLAGSYLQMRQFAAAVETYAALDKLHPMPEDELQSWAEALIGAGKAGEAAKLVAARARKGGVNAKLYALVARVAGKEAPQPPETFIGDKGADRWWYNARFGTMTEKPEEGEPRDGLAALAAARHGGKAFLDALDAAEGDATGVVGRSLALLGAAEALRLHDKERASELLDTITPHVSAAERAAIFDGKDGPELAELPLEAQATMELARAWRTGDRKLIERARADDLLRESVDLALAWK
jgi:Tetratricopeptide repeat